ncbi:hypothetical protein ACFWYW_55475 [Nonomuraea sp. NPDC059023]|uniref:hypothetical protein n=1 Tax=unclassified Nonomuraea TaxID=2593643 RepID=UPI003682B617
MSNEMKPCARDTHCTDRQVVIACGERIQQPAWTYRTFCERDRTGLIKAITDLPHQYVALYQALPPAGGVGPKVSGSKNPPLPLRADVEALMRDMVHVVCSWHEIVSAVAQLAEQGPKRHGRALSDACRGLAARVDALLALDPWPVARYLPIHEAAQLAGHVTGFVHPSAGYAVVNQDLDGGDAGMELLRLHARCRSVLGLTRRRDLLPVPCHACGHVAIYREENVEGMQDEAYCGRCGETYTGAQWRLLQRLTYEEELARQAC